MSIIEAHFLIPPMAKSFDVLVLTEQRYISPTETDVYIDNVLLEDQLVVDALQRIGLKSKRVDWADPTIDWSDTETVLFRTTWDYFDQYPAFQKWMSATEKVTKMINPSETIRWNLDKHYLIDLKRNGINIPETLVIEKGDVRTLNDLMNETGWKDLILKPCISGGAKNTFRLNRTNVAEHETQFKELISEEAFMIQPTQHYVLKEGELSLMVFGGTYTHAVKKIAKAGDFRVQDDWGGTVHLYEPSAEEIAFAEQTAKAVEPVPAYARVDIIRDNDGQLAIMELELIEPELWFRLDRSAADALAKTVKEGWF